MAAFQFLRIERKPSDQLIELLEKNIIGTPGKSMVYKHHNVQAKVHTISDPYFANLSIRNRLYGTVCLSKREVFIRNQSYQAFYLRYFTFRESLRSSNPKDRKRQSDSLIRDDVALLMNGKGLDYQNDLLLYAYVDPGNMRSKRLIEEFGFNKISNFQIIPFSRIFPKNHGQVKLAEDTQRAEIRKLLAESYKEEQFVAYENLFQRGEYFLLMDQGKVVCGAQAVPDQWEILEIPGIVGSILMNIFPKVPILKRLFHPRYKFVFLESIFCSRGHEKKLGSLFESVLSYYRVNSGILCLDNKSPIYASVKKNNMGITHKLQGEKQIDIFIKTTNKKLINSDAPVCVSGFDVL